jgi:hypothetical protein
VIGRHRNLVIRQTGRTPREDVPVARPGKPFGPAHYIAWVQYGTTSKLLSAAVTGSR